MYMNKKEWLLNELNIKGCAICGYNEDNKRLHFHHLGSRTKKHNIADMYNYSNNAIVKEAKKCVCLCDKCHKELHKELGKKVTIKASKEYVKVRA